MSTRKSQPSSYQFKEIYLECIERFCEEHDRTGVVVAGSNGPHQEAETPLRNTAHWIVALCGAYDLLPEERYKSKAVELGDQLCSPTFRPFGASFHARQANGVDRCNGLIGQAWAIEALGGLARLTGLRHYQETGVELALRHKFSEKWAVWHSLDIDGRILNIDNVFNHQLWFAATTSMVNSGLSEELDRRVAAFTTALSVNLKTEENGLVRHHVDRLLSSPEVRLAGLLKHLRDGTLIRRIWNIRSTDKQKPTPDEYRIGYHSFNAYGFALLKRTTRDHEFWSGPAIAKITELLQSPAFIQRLDNNIFSYPYNPPGFEVPVALETLSEKSNAELTAIATCWITRQLRFSYDATQRSMSRNCIDPKTQAARIYEISRLSNEILSAVEVSFASDDVVTGASPSYA
ncbi:MAG: hypothetical protein KJ947_02845 [Alphaproteobacteria bacterium]|jgi:hypothetical protein|nr:hypothetical protein [Alphaproteobacteria bacterium]MBU1548499.1 hypothetical protein [Alphaproteobacteria bacterium]MBU2337695.1 hypothetical protein [Alphaproteobacteria bacterium]MBU2389832.1 hypothetical protein [Alphaproteobacteria bacterium]